jgi:hypothetical protein
VKRSGGLAAIAAPAGAALLGFLATLAVFWPGVMSQDAIGMYELVVSGARDDVKPPLFVDLWRVTDAVICGSGGIFALHVAMHWGAVLAVALAVASGALPRLVLVVVLGLLPPVAGRIAMVSVDCAVVVAWSLAVAVLLHRDLGRGAFAGWRRHALSAAALALIAYGALVRHNALAGVPPLLWLWAAPIGSSVLERSASRRRLAIAIALTLLIAVTAEAVRRTALPKRAWTQPLVWDLAAISLRSGEMLVPDYALRDPSSAGDLERLEHYFSSWSSTRLFYFGDRYATFPLDAESSRRLRHDWRTAIAAHPGAYVAHRAEVAGRLLGFEDVAHGALFHDPPLQSPQMDRCRGPLRARFTPSAASRSIRGLLLALTETPLYATWLWLLAGIVIAAGAGRLRDPRARFARAVACSGLFYVAPLAVVVPGVEFRYTLWLYSATAIAAVLAVSAAAARWRASGRGGAGGTPRSR